MRILVKHFGGYGDAILLVRYAETLRALGHNVLWSTPDALRGVIGTAPGVEQEVRDGQAVFAMREVSMFDLPRMLGTRPGHVGGAQVPYLKPQWEPRDRTDNSFRVGICWHSG